MKTYLLSTLIALMFSVVFCRLLIPVLRRLKAGQNILVYVKEHTGKSGTPTMGGIAFITAGCLTAVLFLQQVDRTTILCLAVGLAYMSVGVLDDFLKCKRKENLGLKAWQKLLLQVALAVCCGVYCLRAGLTELHIPFFGKSYALGAWMFPLAVFVFIATVNAVNLTDGLDGLAAGTSVPFFLAMGIIILLQNGSGSIALLAFCLTGALLGYLLFNVSPASVFMGDTGSLALGGFAAAIATFTGNALYLLVIGGCFVFSVISVLLQVIYYKATGGKRIFLMAPVHHHFQEKGHSETRISYAYFLVTLVLGGVCMVAIL